MYPCRSRLSQPAAAVALTAIVAALAGCAKTEIHSFVDPEFQGRSYQKLVVSVEAEKLDQRDDAETVFAKTLNNKGVQCLKALDLLPPTRDSTEEQFQQAVVQSGADGVLTVRMTEYYEDQVYVPPSATTYTTGYVSSGTYYRRHRPVTYDTVDATSHTTVSGGYVERKPRVRHEVQLWDVKSNKVAWVGSTFTAGDERSRYDQLMTSLAKKVADTLKKEGLLRVVEAE